MRMFYPPPANQKDFELLCLRLLQEEWSLPQLQLYGHTGERQNGIDIVDPTGASPRRAAQCKLHLNFKSIAPTEVRKEVAKVKEFSPTPHLYCILTTAKRSARAQQEVLKLNQTNKGSGPEVQLLTWDDLETLLNKHPRVREEFYDFVPGQFAAALRKEVSELRVELGRLGDRINKPPESTRAGEPEGSFDQREALLQVLEEETLRVLEDAGSRMGRSLNRWQSLQELYVPARVARGLRPKLNHSDYEELERQHRVGVYQALNEVEYSRRREADAGGQ